MANLTEGQSKLSTVQKQLEDANEVTRKNLEKVLDRGERLEALLDRASQLEENVVQFKKRARGVRRNLCWRNWKWTLSLLALLAVIVSLSLVGLYYTRISPYQKTAARTSTTAASGQVEIHV